MANVRSVSWRRVFVLGVALAATLSAAAAQVRVRAVGLTPTPRAVYGTVSTYDGAKKLLTLLEGGITVDVSHARIVGLNGSDTLNPIRRGLQVSIQLEASGAAPGAPPTAWLVEQKTESPASMTGPVDSIDLTTGTFTVDGVVIRPTAATVWKGARSADVRSLAELQVGQAVNLDVDRDDRGIIAQQIFVVGFIPQSTPQVWGFVTKIEGDLWTITPTEGPAVVVRVTSTTLFNSTDGIGQAGLGEFVEVTTSLPNGNNPLVALVITDFPPPQQQIVYSYGMYGALTELRADSLTVTDLNGNMTTLPVDPSTKFFRGAKLGDYVEVRVRVDDVTKAQVVVQVIKTNRIIRLGFTGVVQKIEGNVWTFETGRWKVIVTPQTKIINNPRVGDTVRVVGQTEHGSDTLQADEIERL